jgi:hypothetical protein
VVVAAEHRAEQADAEVEALEDEEQHPGEHDEREPEGDHRTSPQ